MACICFVGITRPCRNFQRIIYDNGTNTIEKIDTIDQNPYRSYRQIRTDFEYLWKTACEAKKLTPVCYDVYGNGFESNSSLATPNRPYAQRYILRPERYNDVYFGFENTLGGFDSLMLEGKQSYQPEGDATTFKNYEEECELVNDYTSIWKPTPADSKPSVRQLNSKTFSKAPIATFSDREHGAKLS